MAPALFAVDPEAQSADLRTASRAQNRPVPPRPSARKPDVLRLDPKARPAGRGRLADRWTGRVGPATGRRAAAKSAAPALGAPDARRPRRQRRRPARRRRWVGTTMRRAALARSRPGATIGGRARRPEPCAGLASSPSPRMNSGCSSPSWRAEKARVAAKARWRARWPSRPGARPPIVGGRWRH